jgi:ubiquinone/menaquinone biosynthesis C-methylase UbiE
VSDIDPLAFREFEHRGWQEIASRYDGGFASVTTQAIEALLDAAHVARGLRVLDVACGPGYVAGASSRRGARALGVDFSSEMVEEARSRYPDVEFQEGDAEQLAFPDASFDAVVSNFGMLHLSRPERAVEEAYRVLRPGGRFAFTVWDTPEKTVGFAMLLSTIKKHGNMDVPIPPGPPFFRFSDHRESRRVLTAAGFSDITIKSIDQIWRLSSPDNLFDIMYNGSVRNAALLRAQKPEVLESIRLELRQGLEKYGTDLAMPAVLVSGIKKSA